VEDREATPRKTSMFSETFEQAGPLITVWLQVSILVAPSMVNGLADD